jgi:hypothetical protein
LKVLPTQITLAVMPAEIWGEGIAIQVQIKLFWTSAVPPVWCDYCVLCSLLSSPPPYGLTSPQFVSKQLGLLIIGYYSGKR